MRPLNLCEAVNSKLEVVEIAHAPWMRNVSHGHQEVGRDRHALVDKILSLFRYRRTFWQRHIMHVVVILR